MTVDTRSVPLKAVVVHSTNLCAVNTSVLLHGAPSTVTTVPLQVSSLIATPRLLPAMATCRLVVFPSVAAVDSELFWYRAREDSVGCCTFTSTVPDGCPDTTTVTPSAIIVAGSARVGRVNVSIESLCTVTNEDVAEAAAVLVLLLLKVISSAHCAAHCGVSTTTTEPVHWGWPKPQPVTDIAAKLAGSLDHVDGDREVIIGAAYTRTVLEDGTAYTYVCPRIITANCSSRPVPGASTQASRSCASTISHASGDTDTDDVAITDTAKPSAPKLLP